jgi:phage-related protein
MKWTIEYYSKNVQSWISKLPINIRAAYAKLTELLTEFGMDLRLPYSRAMGDGLFELRPRGKEGIARVFYCTLVGRRIVVLHGFIKKTQETPRKELEIAIRRMKEVKNAQSKEK